MISIRIVIKKTFIVLSAATVGLFMPLGTLFADPASTCTPPAHSQTGVDWPTGADSNTFLYVCDSSSPYYGEWTSPYYVYNPANGSRSALYSPNYNYDCTSGKWTMDEWDYSPADGQFHLSRVVASAPSGVPTNCPVVPASTSPSGSGNSSANGSGSSSDPTTNGISNTGANSSNTTNSTGNNNVNLNNTNGLGVTNNITGVATTGNAVVLGNTTAGDATSGVAQNMANILNMLQSSSNTLGTGKNVITFTDNINGDVNGDLLLNPATLSSIQNTGSNSTNSANNTQNNGLTVNNSTNASINNNINLASASGNATVADNTTAGNATSGAAQTIANVVNMIQSAVTSGKSFIGTININGNLNGDILLPPNFIDQLLADNVPTVTLTGPNSNNTSNNTTNNTAHITNTNNQGINNTVNGTATSGAANVTQNTTAGNATSGAANNTVTAFNLTGSKVIGANDLLVFVNVAGGKWVGLIVNAPAGTTAAELGGGITSTGPNSTNNTNSTLNNNANINNNNTQQINNNIKTTATSGNATVSQNTNAGNATSGNANNAVNLLNIENTTLDLSNWFGILFINVFGTWNGSFGINTSAGDPIVTSNAPGSFLSAPLLSFVNHTGSTTTTGPYTGASGTQFFPTSFGASPSVNSSTNGNSVLASSTTKTNNNKPQISFSSGHVDWFLIVSSGSIFVIYLLGERFYATRNSRIKV